jgi:hypothetical protein
MTTILAGHISQETAYVADVQFRFDRRQIRYWLDMSKSRGVRLMSQTSNPRRSGGWNKVQATKFAHFAGCLYLDDAGCVQWAELHKYMAHAKVAPWIEQYRAGVPPEAIPAMERWARAVAAYVPRPGLGESIKISSLK